MSNTLIDIRRRLHQGSVTQGWGAIVVLSRSRLNRLLEQEFIASFARNTHLPLITGEASLDAAGLEKASLVDIQLGAPLLSFDSASLTDSRVRLRMAIMAGRYSALHATHSAPKALTSAFTISQAQGYWLEVEIDLAMVVGGVDPMGVVTVDLSKASSFTCNLAGEDPQVGTRLGELFRQRLQGLGGGRGVFRLGVLNLKHYGQLAPTDFKILTQAAPGSKIAGALNWADGAVVVFIRLQASAGDGNFPPSPDFPYLIPSDTHADGSEKYTATLLLAAGLKAYLQVETPQLFRNLKFPGGHVYEQLSIDSAVDIASFGQISQAQASLHLEPAFSVIQAGTTQDFRVLDGQGNPVPNPTWHVVSLEGRTPQSHGTISNGRYTAASAAELGHPTLNVIVTATVGQGLAQRQASALLLVVYDSMAVSPRMAVHPYQADAAPIRLSASTLRNQPRWSLQGEHYGGLQVTGEHQALFTPDPGLGRKSLVAQRIETQGDEIQPLSLLLPSGQQLLAVEPFGVSEVRRSSEVALHDDATLLPGLARRWSVIGGPGSVDDAGLYSAPADGISANSVVLCQVVHNDVVFSSGYSVIELSEQEPGPQWHELTTFTVEASAYPYPNTASMLGNGYQQLEVKIVVKPTPVGTSPVFLSLDEVRSMRLTFENHIDIPPLVPGEDGMVEGDPVLWRTSTHRNDFVPAGPPQMLVQSGVDSDDRPITLYLHSLVSSGATENLHAVFQQDKTNVWWRSKERGETRGTFKVTANPVVKFTSDEYEMIRKRVDGGAPTPGAPGIPADDDFDYHLRTVDYWPLVCKRPSPQPISFKTLKFVAADGSDAPGKVNISTVRWESEVLREEMFSWTGYAFKDLEGRFDYPDTGRIQFDDDLGNIVRAGNEANDERKLTSNVHEGYPRPGEPVFSVHRSDRVYYVPPSTSSHKNDASVVRDRLSKGMYVQLRDQYGNLHKLLIAFDAVNGPVGHRNRLHWSVF